MKRMYILALVLLVTSSLHADQYYDFCVDGIFYNILESNSEVEVTDSYYNTYGNPWGGPAIQIPETVEYMKRTFTVTAIGKEAFMCVNGRHNTCAGVYLPKTIKRIGEKAFYSFYLYDIDLPDGLESIGEQAFVDTKLTSITIPSSVKEIGIGAFRGIVSLANIQVEGDNAIYDSRDNCNAIIETNTNTIIAGCANTMVPSNIKHLADWAFAHSQFEEVSLPNGIESIGASCFSNCDKLKHLDIPSSVTSIGEDAFFACKRIESIMLPLDITKINKGTFEFCEQLKSIEIPISVRSLGKVCFDGCISLQEIVIPDGVESIGERVFAGCTNLTEIIVCSPTPCEIYENTFSDLQVKLSTLYVPTGAIDKYKNAPFWNMFKYIEEYNPSSINMSETNGNEISTYHDIHGRLIRTPQKGLNIVTYKDGKTKKIIVKQ